mmetsp:Transcript_34128/g.25190  ORF Transcript_34128/g.25190 Transcript_34128/m.25190 type:complete len:130 (+) Transcript_34128:1-390(+)
MRSLLGRGSRLSVNIDELRAFSPDLATFVMKSPLKAIKLFEEALNNHMKGLSEELGQGKGSQKQVAQAASAEAFFPRKVLAYHVSFDGNFGENFVTPRGLRSNLVNQMVTVQGIVTRMSMIHPKLSTAV